jgi:hypothetical protein
MVSKAGFFGRPVWSVNPPAPLPPQIVTQSLRSKPRAKQLCIQPKSCAAAALQPKTKINDAIKKFICAPEFALGHIIRFSMICVMGIDHWRQSGMVRLAQKAAWRNMSQTRIILDESEIPTHWYNIVPDLKNPPGPRSGRMASRFRPTRCWRSSPKRSSSRK